MRSKFNFIFKTGCFFFSCFPALSFSESYLEEDVMIAHHLYKRAHLLKEQGAWDASTQDLYSVVAIAKVNGFEEGSDEIIILPCSTIEDRDDDHEVIYLPSPYEYYFAQPDEDDDNEESMLPNGQPFDQRPNFVEEGKEFLKNKWKVAKKKAKKAWKFLKEKHREFRDQTPE